MNNLNEYDEAKFRTEFDKSSLYKQISSDFDIILWDKHIKNLFNITPRQSMGQRIFNVTPFYYLNKLTETNPGKIYDIGCGWNIFKKYVPSIIGIDFRQQYAEIYADIEADINKDYIISHKEHFESAFSICALHYHSLTNLEKIITNFLSMIKLNGRGFLSLNLERMIDVTSAEENINLFGIVNPSDKQYDQYIRSVVEKIPCKYLIVDIDVSVRNEYLNGNIRLVFEKINKSSGLGVTPALQTLPPML